MKSFGTNEIESHKKERSGTPDYSSIFRGTKASQTSLHLSSPVNNLNSSAVAFLPFNRSKRSTSNASTDTALLNHWALNVERWKLLPFAQVPGRGLEPLILAEPDPKSGASANFATLALFGQLKFNKSRCARSRVRAPPSQRRTRQTRRFSHRAGSMKARVWFSGRYPAEPLERSHSRSTPGAISAASSPGQRPLQRGVRRLGTSEKHLSVFGEAICLPREPDYLKFVGVKK